METEAEIIDLRTDRDNLRIALRALVNALAVTRNGDQDVVGIPNLAMFWHAYRRADELL